MKSWTTLEVVHVFIRRSNARSAAVHQAGQASRGHHSPAGLPTKNSLKGWHREYKQDRDLKPVLVRAPKFTEEQKARAVEHYLTHGRCVAFTIKALGYPG